MKDIFLDRLAIADFRAAIRYFTRKHPLAIRPFRLDFARTLDRIQDNPELFAVLSEPHFRYCLFEKFEYGLWYRILGNTIWVVAVAHGKRRLNYWKRRKPPRIEESP